MTKPSVAEAVTALLSESSFSVSGPDQDLLRKQLVALMAQVRTPEIADLWEIPELAGTYWILLTNGIDHSEEREIASQFLLWKAYFASETARFACVQSMESDGRYQAVCDRFGYPAPPVLIVSSSLDMSEHLTISGALLRRLATEPGGLRPFLTQVSHLVRDSDNLKQVTAVLHGKQFWVGLKMAYEELRQLVSVSITSDLSTQ